MKYSLASIIFYPRWVKKALPEKIPGADLIWDLAELAAKNNLSIYLLGGFDNTPKLASEKLKMKNEKLKIAGFSNKNPDDPSIIEDINKSGADLLFVAYGPIKQEKWIAENLSKLNVKLAIGLGGAFDYIAGEKPTPSKFIRRIGLEWLYRLITQPWRLKRIINATFGLMLGLWRYKVFMSLPLRPNVVLAILNQENKILICQRSPKDYRFYVKKHLSCLDSQPYWQLPQGGINENEDLVKAARREALEETGIENLDFVKISLKTNVYIWQNALRTFWKNCNYLYRGQVQNIVYFKFTGDDAQIKMNTEELINYQWIESQKLTNKLHPEKMSLAKIVMVDLKEMA